MTAMPGCDCSSCKRDAEQSAPLYNKTVAVLDNMTDVDVLHEMVGILSDDGWTRGNFEVVGPDGKTRRCVFGALQFVYRKRHLDINNTPWPEIGTNAAQEYRQQGTRFDRAAVHVAIERGMKFDGLVDFNDQKAANVEEVIDMLNAVADYLMAQPAPETALDDAPEPTEPPDYEHDAEPDEDDEEFPDPPSTPLSAEEIGSTR